MTWGVTQQEIPVEELQVGMYVSQLDRPWLETPYLVEGIAIQSPADIHELAQYCSRVWIDLERSAPEVVQRLAVPAGDGPGSIPGGEDAAQFRGLTVYRDACSAADELPAAGDAHALAGRLLDQVRTGLQRGAGIEVMAARQASDTLRESVERNPDALLLLARLRQSGDVLYDHALKCSIHLLALGRHLGLDRGELSVLGLGGLLMDVGKMQLPTRLVDRDAPLSPQERRELKKHVEYGETVLERTSGIPDGVRHIAAQHHEREDGRGYPRGLVANQISAYARMAAIVDSYEEMLANERLASTPYEALRELREGARWGLNSALVDQFTHCVGLFPVGSLVELDSGEVAIVLSHRRTQRFMPRVMRILDPAKRSYAEPLVLDLAARDPESEGAQRQVVRDLPRGAFGVDPARYYQ